MNIFTQYTQTEEFHAKRGDSGNPICLKESLACGTSAEGPNGACCEGLACRCPRGGCTCGPI